MPITLNGTTGVVTPGATVGSITGILKASSGVVSQAVAGSDYGQLTLATAQTASGTAVDFTGIPSWAKRITVMFSGVSTNGASNILIQVGFGSITTSGYSSQANNGSNVTSSIGFIQTSNNTSASIRSGINTINLISSNLYVSSGILADTTNNSSMGNSGGSVSLSGALDRLRVTTVNGTDTFDAGTINISYE